MATRIFCFVIAAAFLASVMGFSIYLIVRYATDDSETPKTAEDINALRLSALDNLGQLDDFTVITERIGEREIQELAVGKAEGEAIQEEDVVTLKVKRALAQSGQVFYDSAELSSQTNGAETFGVDRFCPQWPDGLLGLKEGGKRRLLLPAIDINVCSPNNLTNEWPGNYDLVIDIELVGIADRTDIGSDKPLPDFEPLTEPLTELRVEDKQAGLGPAAVKNSNVVVSYTGVLAFDGSIFDNNKGVRFGLNEVIEGWRDGVVGMKEGGQRRIFIPAELAYGEKGFGESIPPNADLVFDVQLIRVLPAVE